MSIKCLVSLTIHVLFSILKQYFHFDGYFKAYKLSY